MMNQPHSTNTVLPNSEEEEEGSRTPTRSHAGPATHTARPTTEPQQSTAAGSSSAQPEASRISESSDAGPRNPTANPSAMPVNDEDVQNCPWWKGARAFSQQPLMYPLPDLQTLLGLEVYNTYHHHHVHRFMKWGASDDVSGRSTCTDPSHHTHTNHHKIALVETRVYTLHPTSVLPKYFQDNEVRICVSSRVLGTYSHVVVKRSSLEFVHHIVHQHDTHIQHDDYQTVFTVPSVCTQTCTRSTTQCKLHAIQGDFQHHHFHEHIHSILIRPANFIGAPNEVGEFMFLSVTRLNLLNHTVTKLQ